MIRKVTDGSVVQEFSDDGKIFLSQKFLAGDQVSWENTNGGPVTTEAQLKAYAPFDMYQPND